MTDEQARAERISADRAKIDARLGVRPHPAISNPDWMDDCGAPYCASDYMTAERATKCPKCGGAGSYMYDHNHGKPCEVCCEHGKGWFLLSEHYGKDNGRWCCRAGCGETRDENPETLNDGSPTHDRRIRDAAQRQRGAVMTDEQVTGQRDYEGEYNALAHAIVGDAGGSAILTAELMRAEITRLTRGLSEVRKFLENPEWGTVSYMEGTGVYEERDAAIFDIRYALGEVA